MLPLAEQNGHPRDANISFDAERHEYTVALPVLFGAPRPERVPVSVTSFAKSYFKQFDADAVVEANFEKWKVNSSSKYYALIQSTLLAGGSDRDAKLAIKALWAGAGEQASRAGTQMHERFELACNGVDPEAPVGSDEAAEVGMLRVWMREFQPEMQWRPYRTEWPVYYEDERLGGSVLVAGTLDLLLRSEETGEFALVDFKRANPEPKYRGGPPNLLGPCANVRFHPGWASSPLGEVEDSNFGKYTMQLNILAKILRDRYDVEVNTSMYLLQVHSELEEAHCVRVPLLREATDCLFAVEAARRRGGC